MDKKTPRPNNPFIDGRFFKLLKDSNSTGENTGWMPQHIYQDNAQLTGFLKTHSYGEYIFDWAWADFYHKYQIPYYPKLIHAIPFTPVNAPKLIANTSSQMQQLAEQSFENYQQTHALSGEHYLFINELEASLLETLDFKMMKTLQYHWRNRWESFNHFLDTLSKNRRKMIKKERKKIAESELEIKTYTGKEAQEIMPDVFNLYLTTISKKKAYAYLTQDFFKLIPQYLEENLVIYMASLDGKNMAMSIFIESDDTLYGRYWGILPEYQETYPGLHFEMCYYLGMERCFMRGMKLFEAGAQGEHKLWRGFEPVEILSAHHLKIKELFNPVKEYIDEQNRENSLRIEHLKTYLPYRD
jgi:predicted N-acyltransferase